MLSVHQVYRVDWDIHKKLYCCAEGISNIRIQFDLHKQKGQILQKFLHHLTPNETVKCVPTFGATEGHNK